MLMTFGQPSAISCNFFATSFDAPMSATRWIPGQAISKPEWMMKAETIIAPTESANQRVGKRIPNRTATSTGMELYASLLWCHAFASTASLRMARPFARV